MASYKIAYSISRRNEGGYNPGDSGGETYKGVSRKANPNWAGWKIIYAYKKANGPIAKGAYINNTQLDQLVINLFKSNYWDMMRLDEVDSQNIANIMFDFSLTSNWDRSAIDAQKAAGLTADGKIGTDSLRALNGAKEKDLAKKILAYNQQYYSDLAKKPKYASYLHSWTSRIDYFSSIIDKIPGGAAGGAAIVLGLIGIGTGIFFLAGSGKGKKKK